MVVYIHGFDWVVYSGYIMPAFARWLIDEDESLVYQLFEKTQCAREEQYLPDPMQRLRIWPRARAFMKTLPRGTHSRREYAKLCSADHFTALSDRYMYKHTPRLYQNSDAVRAVWGAIIEEYCLPWFSELEEDDIPELEGESSEVEVSQSEQIVRSELVSLLHAAGLAELAKEIGEEATEVERFDWELEGAGRRSIVNAGGSVNEGEETSSTNEESSDSKPVGIEIGQHPNTLHMRGWLAGISVRAMALFEYLACGRRCMPFGFEAGEPFGSFVGYLTPDEVWQLAKCLRNVTAPIQSEAEEDSLSFRQQLSDLPESFRLVDEILPAYSMEFLKAVRGAALQGLGLICSVE